MTLEQHLTQNQAKNARRWTLKARDWLALAEFPRWRWLAMYNAASTVALHSRKASTVSEARRLLAILETR